MGLWGLTFDAIVPFGSLIKADQGLVTKESTNYGIHCKRQQHSSQDTVIKYSESRRLIIPFEENTYPLLRRDIAIPEP